MRGHLLIYLRLVGAGFRRRTSYRAAMAAGVVANAMFGLIRGSILAAALTAAGGSLGGYAASTMSTYNWLTQAALGPINVWGSEEIEQRIRSGDIAVDFARPVDLQLGWLAQDVGSALAAIIPRSIPTLIVGALTFGIALPRTPLPWLFGAVSFLLALVVSYLARFALQVIGFWIVDTRGLRMLYAGFAGLLGGLILPVHVMPDWMRAIAYATPFPAMLQDPVDILSGLVGTSGSGPLDVLLVLGRQLAWAVVLLVLGRVLLRAGHSRLVVQGG